ncbi:DNA-binding transcriptional regulator, MarR family [Oryzisolibacter propanilivorax]|uniref:DNA-binding transcriptional regulator, MarR family n=1 Tax=Oryzisolibacter propanilivorax TaxID=1527607 RepID=A0A1G9QSN4_9BURK|nr:MarR family transcriptional regulator [Oryzisolibacter propanilivorax]SDM14032.1 DNA-binding transcriptional regulator, MarR family [Oryzisolibacter propanilivorax]
MSAPDSTLLPVPYALERSVGLQLRRIVNQLGAAVEQHVEPLGLTDAQWKPLLRLHLGEHANASALARDCHIDSGGLTRLLDRLEAKGLVQRERAPHDRRVVQVALTDSGRTVAARLPALLAAAQDQLLQGFDAAEQQALRGYLDRLEANLQTLATPPPASARQGPG